MPIKIYDKKYENKTEIKSQNFMSKRSKPMNVDMVMCLIVIFLNLFLIIMQIIAGMDIFLILSSVFVITIFLHQYAEKSKKMDKAND